MSTLDGVIARASERLGYSALRPNQYKAIKSFLEGKDVFVALPTGSGKSLCFAILPFAFDDMYGRVGSIALIVSPLKALMKDQVSSLSSRGLSAAYVNGETENDKSQLTEILNGKFHIIFISPELLLTNLTWREMIRTRTYMNNLVAFVVDEAHCIPKWGQYFRNEFSKLGEVRSLIPSHVKIMTMTATATKDTTKKVISILGMDNPIIVAATPDKANVFYCVREHRGSIEEVFGPVLKRLQTERTQMGRLIVYCRRCEECASIYEYFLSSLKHEFTEPIAAPNQSEFRLIDMYTSITEKDVQDTIISSFCQASAPLRIVVCTIAFGMGLDCVDVKEVIHWGPAPDLESYMQECGRAGRNGQFSDALLYVKCSDLKKVSKEMKEYCLNKSECRRALLCSYFDCDRLSVTGCSCCDICARSCACSNCNHTILF
ncbi:hypothetical protein EMCRGX_G018451 [Ephydatia muelleri]